MSIEEINEKFIHPYNEYSSQNSLMTLLSADLNKIKFILYISLKAFQPDIYKLNKFQPDPTVYFPRIYGETIVNEELVVFFNFIKDINRFFYLIKSGIRDANTSDDNLISYLLTVVPLGMKFIKLLYFIIFTNTVAFSTVTLPELNDRGYLFKVSHNDEKEREFYNISTESKILMHGTSINNVYSIMRNGVKTMSGSKYEINGAAHGSGIYLTDKPNDAKRYGSLITGEYGNKSESICILFFKSKNLNLKGNNFCYVQQESDIILRFILWISEISTETDEKFLLQEISKQAELITYMPINTVRLNPSLDSSLLRLPNGSNEPLNDINVIETTRFKKEINALLKIPLNNTEETIIKANFYDPDNRRTPLLVLMKPDRNTDLYKDLVKYNIPGLLIVIYFPSGTTLYPFTPPKMRLVAPMFIDGSGRVTKGGSFCADMLYPDGWSSSTTVEGLIRNLAVIVATEGSRNGPGRVDPGRLNEVYSYSSYVNSHNEIAGFHGYTA